MANLPGASTWSLGRNPSNQAGHADDRVDHPAGDARDLVLRATEDRVDEVEVEEADEAPVQRPDDGEDEENFRGGVRALGCGVHERALVHHARRGWRRELAPDSTCEGWPIGDKVAGVWPIASIFSEPAASIRSACATARTCWRSRARSEAVGRARDADKGIDVDPERSTMLDGDSDGRIRVHGHPRGGRRGRRPRSRSRRSARQQGQVELAAIADDKVVAGAKRMLTDLGKSDAKTISVDDASAITKAFAETVLNGDGIVIPASTEEADLRKVIEDAIACVGSVVDRSGKPGIDQALADQFFAEVDARAAWIARRGDATACSATRPRPRPARCARSARRSRTTSRGAGSPRSTRAALRALGGQEPTLVALGARTLRDRRQLAQLPLAKDRAGGPPAARRRSTPRGRRGSRVRRRGGRRRSSARATPDGGRTRRDRRASSRRIEAGSTRKPATKVDALDATGSRARRRRPAQAPRRS